MFRTLPVVGSSMKSDGKGMTPAEVSATTAGEATLNVWMLASWSWGKTRSTAADAFVVEADGASGSQQVPSGNGAASGIPSAALQVAVRVAGSGGAPQVSPVANVPRNRSSCATWAGVSPPVGWFSGFSRFLLAAMSAMNWSALMGKPSDVFTPASPPRSATA